MFKKNEFFFKRIIYDNKETIHKMFNVFSFSNKSGGEYAWVYVESDDIFIARCLLMNYYDHSKNVKYVGKFEEINDIEKEIPQNCLFDGYCYDSYLKFKMGFLLN